MSDSRCCCIFFAVLFGILFVWWLFSGGKDINPVPVPPKPVITNFCQQTIYNPRLSSTQQYVQNYLGNLKLNDTYTDIDITYSGGVFRAHKIILAAQSRHLDKIMWHQSQNNETQHIDLSFLDSEVATTILNYLYGAGIKFDNFAFASGILKAADGLGLESLKCESSKYLSRIMYLTNVGRLLVTADQANSPYLMTNATRYFFNNLDRVKATHEWKAVIEEHKYILTNAIDYYGKLPKHIICDIQCYPTTLQSPTIVDRLVDLFESGRFADVEVSSGMNQSEYKFQVNKAVLIGQSYKFRQQFEQSPKAIEILGFDKMAVREFFLYMYSGRIDNLVAYSSDLCVLSGSSEYEMSPLRALCENSIIENLTVSNAVLAIKTADRLRSTRLSKIVSDFIIKHQQEIVKTPEWADLKKNYPEIVANIFS